MRLASGLSRTGHYSASILALKEGSGRLRARAREAGFDSLHCLGRSSVLSLPDTVAAVRRAVRDARVQILYSFLFHPNIVSRLAARRLDDVLVVNGERSMPGRRRSFRSVLRRWTSSMADGYTAVSDAVRQAMIWELGVPQEKVRTIRNGVDLAKFPERRVPRGSRSRLRVLAIGSISPEKSFGTLVEALALLRERKIDCTILGEGPGRAALEEKVRLAGLSDRIDLPGHDSDIGPHLREADLFVQSSVREGLSNALLAAMASGLPVVATDVGGTREAVSHGVTGLLVPPRNPGALAEAIRRLIVRPEEAGRMGGNGRKRAVEEFPAERELAETVRWIEELLRRRSAGTAPATSRT